MAVALTPEGWARVAALEFQLRAPRLRPHHLFTLETLLIHLFGRAMRQSAARALVLNPPPSPEENRMPVVNYWDIEPRRRALMSREEVEACLDYELARQGVLKVKAPEMLPIEPVDLPTSTYYRVKSDGFTEVTLFRSLEEANAFISLRPLASDYSYEVGPTHKYAKEFGTLSIEQVELTQQDVYTNALKTLRENKANADANEKAQKDYLQECRAMDNATAEVWSDWHQQQDLERRYQKLLATWKEYLGLTQGDAGIALGFLLKVFPTPDIQAARTWLGEDWDAPEPLEHEGGR